jgi:hypothetical protein
LVRFAIGQRGITVPAAAHIDLTLATSGHEHLIRTHVLGLNALHWTLVAAREILSWRIGLGLAAAA